MENYCLETYDPEDETINFGNRNVGNDLFESVTLMSLQYQPNTVGGNARICSYMDKNTLYFSVDHCLWIISDIEPAKIDLEMKFDVHIDAFKLIDNYLLIGLTNGQIQLIDITTKQVVSTCCLCENVWLDTKFFIGIYDNIVNNNAELSFLVLNKKGVLYSVAIDLENNFEMKPTLLVQLVHNITSATYANGRIIAIGNKCFVYDVFDNHLDDVALNDGVVFKDVWTCNKNSFIALKTDGTLCKICAHTLLFHDLDFEAMDNFTYYYHKNKTFLYFLATYKNHPDSVIIKLIEYKDRNEIFRLEVNDALNLVFNNDEDVNQMYISMVNSQIRVNLIKEAKPEGRLQRLIRKYKFEEAEAFAAQYKLSRLDIDKAKVAILVEKTSCIDTDVENFIALMNNIPDVYFNVQNCLKLSCETIQGVERVLDYALSLDVKDIDDYELETEFRSIVSRFDAYKVLARSENVEMNTSDWKYFAENSLKEHLQLSLRKRKLESAIILFSRIGKHFFSKNSIVMTLDYLDDYPIKSYTSFLYTMIPRALCYMPTALPLFIERIVIKIKLLEKRKREVEFPECAIEFIDNVSNILGSSSVASIYFLSDEVNIDIKKETEILVNISKCLNTILELKNNYDIYLPLNECLQGPGAMLRVLLKLNIGCVEKFLQEFLIQFMIRNGFNADEILSGEVRDLLTYQEKDWAHLVPPIWRSVSSTEERLHLLLDILKAAAKPWCNEIGQMLNIALKMKHPLVTEIEFEVKNEPKYIVLHRPGYNLEKETLDLMESDMYVINRIMYCNQPTLIEDVYTLCSSEARRIEANFYLIQNFIQRGEIAKVISLVQSHSTSDIFQYIYRLLAFHEPLIKDNVELRKNFMKCLNYIIEKTASCGQSLPVDTQRFKICDVVYDVLPTNHSNLNLMHQFGNHKKRMEILNLLIEDLSEHLSQNPQEEIDFASLLRTLNKYADVFEIQPEEILFKLCQTLNDFSLLENSANYVCENSEDIKTMCLMTTLILKSVGTQREDMCATFLDDTVINEDNMGKPIDEKVLRNCLSLARKIAGRAFLMSKGETNVSKVYDWAITTQCLVAEKSENMLFPNRFPLSGNASHSSTINAIRDVFVMFTSYLNDYCFTPSVAYICSYAQSDASICNKDDFFCTLLAKLKLVMQGILRENNFWTAQRLLTTIQYEVYHWGDFELAQKFTAYIIGCRNKFTTKVFAMKNIDEELTFMLLVSYPRNKALKIINDALITYKFNIDKFESFVKLGVKLTKYYGTGDKYGQFMLCLKWWKAIKDCSIPYKEFCMMLGKSELIVQLIQLNHLTLPQIAEICADFKLDLETYYLKYLHNLISTWKPVFDVELDSFGNRSMVVKSQEQELIKNCMSVIELVKTRDAVLKCINDLWKTTNFYHYEIYITILIIAANLNDARHMNFKMALQFLKNYSRSSKPSSVEIEEWFSRFCHQPLDPIAEWRFPFSTTLFTPDLWKILRPEVNLSNYEKWFDLVGILKHLNVNDICSYVIKDITFIMQCEIEECGYYLHTKFDHLFLEIDKCIGYITSPLTAASIAFSLIAKTPEGADKVSAAKLAFKYAKIYKNSKDIENDHTYNNIHKMYYNYLSRHILHVHNLATPEYISKLNDPEEMIQALFRDERILNAGNSCLSNCPNINKVVDELGKLFQIDTTTKRKELLNTLLCDDNTFNRDMSQSIYLSPDVNFVSDENVECVLRASYICSGDDVEFWRGYLYSLALELAGKCLFQGRIFKTFCMITSPDEIEQRVEVSYNCFLTTVDKFFLIHDIQSLGMSIDMERLEALPKHRFIHKLSKNLSNPLNVKIITSICTIYEIYDLAVWEKIMLAMIELDMITELKNCLNRFVKQEIIVRRRFYIQVWQTVIDNAFKLIEDYKGSDLEKVLIENIHYIQICPVSNQLNYKKVQQICLNLKRYDLAALFLQYIPENDQADNAKHLLLQIPKKDLLASLEKLSYLGFFGLQYISKLITRVE